MDLLIAVLVILFIAGVAYWAVRQLAAAFGLPAPIVVVAQVVIVVAACVALVERLGWVRI